MSKATFLKAAAVGLLSLSAVACYGPAYGPAPHQPVGYYQPWGYYYYPSVRVYFQYSTGYYFYPSGGSWVRSRILPPYIRLDPRDRVTLHIESERPYLKSPEIIRKYPPRQDYRPTPERDRKERNNLQKWYQEQQQYKRKR